MSIEFKKISDFKRGILLDLLKSAYSFDKRYEQTCEADWQEFDNFFFDNLNIADQYGFITTLNGEPIGFVSWDPRNMPEYVEIGFNGIASKYKGNGYGRMQLEEAVKRIKKGDMKKIIVTTNDLLVPAQHTYESVGFKMCKRRKNESNEAFSGEYIDYVYELKKIYYL